MQKLLYKLIFSKLSIEGFILPHQTHILLWLTQLRLVYITDYCMVIALIYSPQEFQIKLLTSPDGSVTIHFKHEINSVVLYMSTVP